MYTQLYIIYFYQYCQHALMDRTIAPLNRGIYNRSVIM